MRVLTNSITSYIRFEILEALSGGGVDTFPPVTIILFLHVRSCPVRYKINNNLNCQYFVGGDTRYASYIFVDRCH